MRQWTEAAIGRRQLAKAMRRLVIDGFQIRDVLVDGDSAQHSDRLLVGPQGIFLVGFRTLPSNIWRPGRGEPSADTMAAYAQATHRLAEVVSASLLSELVRLHVRVHPLLALIGPEQPPGALIAGIPVLGPAALLDHLTSGPHVLTPMQVDALVDRIDDWLALRSVTTLHSRGGRPGHLRSNRKSL